MTVYCDRENCVFCKNERCDAGILYIDKVGFCITYESKEQEEEE